MLWAYGDGAECDSHETCCNESESQVSSDLICAQQQRWYAIVKTLHRWMTLKSQTPQAMAPKGWGSWTERRVARY